MSFQVGRIGLDPELAIVSKKTGKGRSAHTFLKEKREFRFNYDGKPPEEGRLGAEVERDGAAIEVRSVIASACRDNIIPYVAEAMRQTALDLEKWRKGHFQLSSAPMFVLDGKSLEDAPEDVSTFGCQPDLNAYTLDVKSPECPDTDRRRYTGGHVHASAFRTLKNDVKQQAALAILYDYFVAMPFVGILGEKFREGEAERREFYGQPGSFRWNDELMKIEFRTLSGRMMLHPTILAWVLGVVKMMAKAITPDPIAFLQGLNKKLPSTVVYETIMTHDVDQARALSDEVFKLLPTYRVDEDALRNPMSGGGGGTMNPYFYEMAWRVFSAAEQAGLMWDDDLVNNWGLYPDYEPKHHAYWGIQTAMVGLLDDRIFPMNAILPDIWPKGLIQKSPIYTHPENGGAKQYVTPGAAGWLA